MPASSVRPVHALPVHSCLLPCLATDGSRRLHAAAWCDRSQERSHRTRMQSRTRTSKFDFIKLDAASLAAGWLELEENQEALCEARCFMADLPATSGRDVDAALETFIKGDACQGHRGYDQLATASELRAYCRSDLVAGAARAPASDALRRPDHCRGRIVRVEAGRFTTLWVAASDAAGQCKRRSPAAFAGAVCMRRGGGHSVRRLGSVSYPADSSPMPSQLRTLSCWRSPRPSFRPRRRPRLAERRFAWAACRRCQCRRRPGRRASTIQSRSAPRPAKKT